MGQIYNLYCDESCHLENDRQKAMAMGTIWCPIEKKDEIFKRIREIKNKHGLGGNFEIKWSKVSPGKIDFYLEIVDYFFDNDDIHFRCLVVPDKEKLDHKSFNQTHDDWYYKMYFDLLKIVLSPEDKYRIYIDIKDTRGGSKTKKLHEILCNNIYDFNREIVEKVQIVKSNEIELMQVCDLLIGAVSYINRSLTGSKAKERIIDRAIERSKYSLLKSTLCREDKFNIFIWDNLKKTC